MKRGRIFYRKTGLLTATPYHTKGKNAIGKRKNFLRT